MFLEDELEQALEQGKTGKELFEILRSRIEDPVKVGEQGFINSFKKIDSIWKSFCKKHPEFNPDGFREISKILLDDDDFVKNVLKW